MGIVIFWVMIGIVGVFFLTLGYNSWRHVFFVGKRRSKMDAILQKFVGYKVSVAYPGEATRRDAVVRSFECMANLKSKKYECFARVQSKITGIDDVLICKVFLDGNLLSEILKERMQS